MTNKPNSAVNVDEPRRAVDDGPAGISFTKLSPKNIYVGNELKDYEIQVGEAALDVQVAREYLRREQQHASWRDLFGCIATRLKGVCGTYQSVSPR